YTQTHTHKHTHTHTHLETLRAKHYADSEEALRVWRMGSGCAQTFRQRGIEESRQSTPVWGKRCMLCVCVSGRFQQPCFCLCVCVCVCVLSWCVCGRGES